ncbi:hypothetical protein [Actinokineospora cianjurensis]|uniref:Uncharacterized protein n=1 Tax=Actinokineospora cianjurensis TaxID=585224 RepID=A0A421B1A3_9PSEU|nr:hypothetical protein [Actinokineospora cianjurensis]RLK58108.1 hypothetical protein CLV68_4202 [Actinokineospora cianjurensis]
MARPLTSAITVATTLLALLTTTAVTSSATAAAATDSLRPSVVRQLLLRNTKLILKLKLVGRNNQQDEGQLGEGDAQMAEDGTEYPNH